MKKIIATALFMIFCFNVIAVNLSAAVFAADELAMNESMIKKMNILKILDIIPQYNELNADLTEEVTRADFASIVAKMLRVEEYSGEMYYYDVPQNHWAFKEISLLTKLGIAGGYSGKLFAPDDVITMTEAYTIIVKLLGQGIIAEQEGGYPYGYLKVATTEGLTEGSINSENLTVGYMFTLLYNTLDARVMEFKNIKGESVNYQISENNTYLNVYYNIYKDKGILENVDGIGYTEKFTSQGYVCIDEVQYLCDSVGLDWLGEEIEFFYEKKDKSDSAASRQIIYASKTGKSDVFEATVDNDADFDKSTYEFTYEGDVRSKTIQLSRGIKVLYNGAVVDSALSSILSAPVYKVKFVKNEEGIYDIAVVKASENYVVKSFDTNNNKVYDKLVEGRILSVNQNDYEHYKIHFQDGTPAALSDINSDSVLSVYKSTDDTYFEIVICNSVAEGVISSIGVKNGKKCYIIDKNEYFMSNVSKVESGLELKVGESVRFLLDDMGKIAYAEVTKTAYLPGYIIDVALKQEGVNNTFQMKYFDNKGIVRVVDGDDVIKINGETVKDTERAYSLLKSDKGQFALIKCNSDGMLKGVDTVASGDGGSEDILRVNIPETPIKDYRNSMGTYFWDKGVAGPNTLIFYVPTDANLKSAKDKDFAIVDRSDIKDSTTSLVIESYKTKEKVGFEEFVVVKTANNTSVDTSYPILVESIECIMDENGDLAEKLIGWQRKETVELVSLPEFSFTEKGVGEGDVICCYMTTTGKVADLLVRYDYDENNPAVSNGNAEIDNSNLNANGRYYTGYVNDVVDGVIKVGYNSKEDCNIILDPSYIPVLVYDKLQRKGMKIYEGSVDDAITPEMDYSKSSLVFVNTVWVSPRCIIIYK